MRAAHLQDVFSFSLRFLRLHISTLLHFVEKYCTLSSTATAFNSTAVLLLHEVDIAVARCWHDYFYQSPPTWLNRMYNVDFCILILSAAL